MWKVQINQDISSFSAFKTPAIARYFFEIKSELDIPDLLEIYRNCKNEWLPVLILGSGTNCLFAFDIFPGLVISTSIKWIQEVDDTHVYIGSSELVSPFSIQYTKEQKTNALVPWIWLPGTFGWAIVGNAGCFWLETKDILISVKVVNLDTGSISTILSPDLRYSYRNSVLKNQWHILVLGGSFNISPRDENPYSQKNVIEMLAIRREKQPAGISCGSFYTNPVGYSAGKLIDEAGCKWMRVGWAQISEKHGNFFLVEHNVVYQDILSLSEIVKLRVYKYSGIELHEEVRIITTNF
jgi:UDP-N-acetylmuramate dehydrogenase